MRKKRHKGRGRKRQARFLESQARRYVQRSRKLRLRQWAKHADDYESRAFVSTQPHRSKASCKVGPKVYHVIAFTDGEWKQGSFSTRSIKSTRIKGLHSPSYTMPTIGNSGTVAVDGTKSKIRQDCRKLLIVGNNVRFMGFSADDVLSLGIPRGKNGFKIGNGYIVVSLSVIGLDKLREMQSFLSRNQF